VLLPSIVAGELRHPSAPRAVQAWMERLPGWVDILSAPEIDDPALKALDAGERSAIALGLALKADLILIDERRGAAVALGKGLEVTGTLGILDAAAERGLVDLKEALERLKSTNFRYPPDLIEALLKKHE
jgi:predicted nucleic acid-binding protein